ncbi:hypothetical protein SAMN05443292_1349 [Halpernia frigidisoli]|uniref:Uncharacterized protein n=1 Tax=Halpernia frigidisoli TaxID=1125876 RepID=A0A1I3FFG4_9FLAO|nr:hypothetical protein SAMN05443292_1349 [Halpernia frigidisoli]
MFMFAKRLGVEGGNVRPKKLNFADLRFVIGDKNAGYN